MLFRSNRRQRPHRRSPVPLLRQKPEQLQNRLRNLPAMLRIALQGGQLRRKHCRQNSSRAERKQASSRRKKIKLLWRKKIPCLRAEADQQAKLAVEAVHQNLAGTGTCCMTVSTVPGSNQPRTSPRAQKSQ